MCGIAGILDLKGQPPDVGVVRRMTAAIAHRGPDDDGYFCDRGVALGFRRLSIVDLSGGHQPMTSDCRRFTVIFNGEIYNHDELRTALEKDHGARFRTRSDTEVILAAYRLWGEAALERFNGMFALAIWDSREQELFLARDRMGKKPLYYARVGDELCFASEIKALFQHPRMPRSVARERIPAFLAYRYMPGAETLFEGIRCLPAASWLRLTSTGEVGPPPRYWECWFEPPNHARPADLGRDLESLLGDSVRLRRLADVPVGAFLSGGLDSSLIVALMSRLHPEPLKTFSIGFDTGFSEAGHARRVAQAFGTDHHELIVGSQDLIAHLPRVLHARETPVTEASDIPIFLLSREARRKVTVVLSGEGSDEIFAGYPKYAFEHQLGQALDLVPKAWLAGVASLLPFGLRRAQLALEAASQSDVLERHATWFGAFGPQERRAVLREGLLQGDGLHVFSHDRIGGRHPHSRVDEMQFLDVQHWLPANLLLRGDRMTMAHSLELRCPFLDFRLVEFAAQRVPVSAKIHGGKGKWLLKRLAETLLPAGIAGRAKWGFKVPTSQWFRGALRGVLGDTLLSPAAKARGYFREARLRELIDEHGSGRRDHDKQLWILFQLELWHLMFVDRTLGESDLLS